MPATFGHRWVTPTSNLTSQATVRVPRAAEVPKPVQRAAQFEAKADTRQRATPTYSLTSPGTVLSYEPVQGAAQFPKAGPPGPAGAAGGEPQVFEFDAPSEQWVCAHGLGRLPEVTAYDLDGNCRPLIPITNPDPNTTVLSPTPPLAGKVLIT